MAATDADLKGFYGGFASGDYGYFVPYTNGAQDVIETLFPTQVTFGAWPQHVHAM